MTKPTVGLPYIHILAGKTSVVAGGALFSPMRIALWILIATQVLLALPPSSSQHRIWLVFYWRHSSMN